MPAGTPATGTSLVFNNVERLEISAVANRAIYVDQQQKVFASRQGDSRLSEVDNPPEDQAYCRVEEQFTNAIRETEQVDMVPFETGVHYMEWTEAVIRSSQTGQAISLPL